MANQYVNKVIVGGETKLDLTGDTVTAEKLFKGVTARAADGQQIVGTAEQSTVNLTQYAATLLASAWTNDGNYSHQTVTVAGLKAAYAISPDVDCVLTGTDAQGDAAVLQGCELVHMCDTADNALTALCIGSAPDVNIPIIIRVFAEAAT